ncbi:UNVERIFIED_ORG: hypothetical protein ABID33_004565 [Xanthobacter viscosus]|jgi:hypothetical protein|uniref:DUF1254 domain-containing protein n=1 Tax=Xanthobacter autotrophicus TaxID=280 RepID=A0A6C1KG55_XANAU|nr:DUF1254 domain-containing protein [Xanthobacter autotrophicus]
MTRKFLVAATLLTIVTALMAQPEKSTAQALAASDVRAITKESVIYGFPLVDNYRVLYSYFVDAKNNEFKAPWNALYNVARVFTPDDKAIQTPNSDTPYSFLGADLRAEPLVLSVPDVTKDRYYSLQFIDLYTYNFAYVGSRATGNAAGNFLLAGPGWKGEKPDGIKEIIRSETDFAFVLYRTQLKGPDDVENVKKIQAEYRVQPLSKFLAEPAPAAAPRVDFFKPVTAEEERKSLRFFDELNFILQFAPPHPSEVELRERLATIGIVPGKPFYADQKSAEFRQAVSEGMADAWKALADFKAQEIDTGKRTSADGFGNREFLNGDYLGRMAAAAFGIYGNSKEEAIYPAYFVDSEGRPLDGAKHRYTLRFGPGELPPVKAFWSLTMYELPASLLVANPLKRYLINSAMLPGLKRDADGGITLYLQHDSPDKDAQSNWLPAPAGPFWATMRLYWPQPAALDGKWKAPPLERAAQN